MKAKKYLWSIICVYFCYLTHGIQAIILSQNNVNFAKQWGFNMSDPQSAAYAAGYVAKNIVAAGLAKRCEIQLAYAIGVAEPVSIMVETFGTGIVDDSVIEQAVEHVFDLRPAAIIEQLDLRKPIYKQLAAYGHMGREELGVKWENTDKVEALKAAVNG